MAHGEAEMKSSLRISWIFNLHFPTAYLIALKENSSNFDEVGR